MWAGKEELALVIDKKLLLVTGFWKTDPNFCIKVL